MSASLSEAIDRAIAAKDVADEDLVVEPELASEDYFRVTDDNRAAWVVSRILGLDEEEERVRAQAARLLDEIDRKRRAFFDRFVPELAELYPPPDLGGASHVDLATGRVQWRRPPAQAVYDGQPDDRARLAAWLDEHASGLVKRVPQPDAVEIDVKAAKALARERVAEALEALRDLVDSDEVDALDIEKAIAAAVPDGMRWKDEGYQIRIEAPRK